MRKLISSLWTLLWALLLVAVIVMWVRSRWILDSYYYTTSPYQPVQHLWGILSCDGRVSLTLNSSYRPNLLVWARDMKGLEEDWGGSGDSERITKHEEWPYWGTTTSGRRSWGGFDIEWDYTTDRTLRSIEIPYYCLFIVSAIVPALWLRRRWAAHVLHRRRRKGLCPACGYDLRASPERCPECGRSRNYFEPEKPRSGFPLSLVRPGSLGVLVVAAVSIGAGVFWYRAAQPRAFRAPQPTPEALATLLKPGMDMKEVGKYVVIPPKVSSEYDPRALGMRDSDYRKVLLADGATLVLEFPDTFGSKVRTATPLRSFQVLRIDDLKPSVPEELFSAIRWVHLAAAPIGRCFDPVRLVRSVNALQSLEKPTVIRALRAYVELAAADFERAWRYDLDERRAMLVAQVLFEGCEATAMKQLAQWGCPSPDVKAQRNDWPCYPVVLQNDLPFCLIEGYRQHGKLKSMNQFFDHCEQVGRMRRLPLAPTSTPLQAAEQLMKSDRWARSFLEEAEAKDERALIRMQAMRAVKPFLKVLRDEDWRCYNWVTPEAGDRIWQHFLRDDDLARMRWDSQGQQYVIKSR